jgi:hypothetical protein
MYATRYPAAEWSDALYRFAPYFIVGLAFGARMLLVGMRYKMVGDLDLWSRSMPSTLA